ncbi:hypothetical protein A2U01_0087615, partial [Trifolium medium]|nr:hypothetical protein [Trifolium medium]
MNKVAAEKVSGESHAISRVL